MKSNDLFSHPYEPERAASNDGDSDPVTNPVFSDSPQRDPSATQKSPS